MCTAAEMFCTCVTITSGGLYMAEAAVKCSTWAAACMPLEEEGRSRSLHRDRPRVIGCKG